MIRILLQGRLGNHLFQIATALALGRAHKTRVVIDPCRLPEISNGLLLRRLPALRLGFPRSLASVDLDRLIQKVTGRHTHELLRQQAYKESSHAFDPAVLTLGPKTTLDGFFQNERYFSSVSEEIRRWFDLTPWAVRASADARKVAGRPGSVGVHVRRADYLNPEHRHFHVCGPAYYRHSMARIRASVTNARFVIVSDDTEWCRGHFNQPDTLVVERRPDPYSMLADMALFSSCEHQIISNSSFSWWGAWLNPNPCRIVLAPDRWTTDGSIPIETKTMRGFETVSCSESAST